MDKKPKTKASQKSDGGSVKGHFTGFLIEEAFAIVA